MFKYLSHNQITNPLIRHRGVIHTNHILLGNISEKICNTVQKIINIDGGGFRTRQWQ